MKQIDKDYRYQNGDGHYYIPLRAQQISFGHDVYRLDGSFFKLDTPKHFEEVLNTSLLTGWENPQHFTRMLCAGDITTCGWEAWEEENYSTEDGVWVEAFTIVSDSNSYMLTFSTDYVKLIVKGSEKKYNLNLFQGKLRTKRDLLRLMDQVQTYR